MTLRQQTLKMKPFFLLHHFAQTILFGMTAFIVLKEILTRLIPMLMPLDLSTIAKVFYYINYGSSIITSNVRQIISVMKT